MRLQPVTLVFFGLACRSGFANPNGGCTTEASTAQLPSQSYTPPVPSSYANCIFDPNNSSRSIVFFSNQDGIPFINVDNRAVLTTDANFSNLPSYHFAAAPGGLSGVYDLVSDSRNLFLAVFQDGHVGFTEQSSYGQNVAYVHKDKNHGHSDGHGQDCSHRHDCDHDCDHGGHRNCDNEDGYVTTIWSVDCNGSLYAGIIGGPEFQFGLSTDGKNELRAQETGTGITKRGIFGFLRRVARVVITVIKIIICPAEILHARTDLALDEPRCPDSLVALTKWNGPAVVPNGCGTSIFKFNFPPFVSCCNRHDICFGSCDTKFLNCNKAFQVCTDASCSIMAGIARLGCELLSATFSWTVESEIGRFVFGMATREHCTCCQYGASPCPFGCADLTTDPNNCGDCGTVCSSGRCVDGNCFSDGV